MQSPRRLPSFLVVIILYICCFSSRVWSAAASGLLPSGEADTLSEAQSVIVIPGPLRSFLRMAGISQKISPEEVVPLLAHNIFTQGYEGSRDGGRPTEFLILLNRYVHQARELGVLAGPDGAIHVSNCDEAKPVLRVLGYRVRQDCGQSSTS